MTEDIGSPDRSNKQAAAEEPEDVRPLPQSLTEYLDVWCADLLEPLTDQQRFEVRNGVAIMYAGGPWPDRLRIQRSAEVISGAITSGTALGEIDLKYSSIAREIEHLADPSRRERALKALSSFQGDPELVTAVEGTYARGLLSDIEKTVILDAALSQPFLPDPVPLPHDLRPLPADHPESYADSRAKRENVAIQIPPHVQARFDHLLKQLDAGAITWPQYRERLREAWYEENDHDCESSSGSES